MCHPKYAGKDMVLQDADIAIERLAEHKSS